MTTQLTKNQKQIRNILFIVYNAAKTDQDKEELLTKATKVLVKLWHKDFNERIKATGLVIRNKERHARSKRDSAKIRNE